MIKLEIKGVDALIKKYKSVNDSLMKDVQSELNAWADDVATDAKLQLSKGTSNTGRLQNSISPEYMNMKAGVKASANYASYIEFGTRKFAASYVGSLPKEWQTIAAQSKGGTGGTFADMVAAIRQWMKERGYDEKNAYPAALNILRNGIRPQPFLFPAVNKNNPELRKNLNNIFKDLK
jgi:HK97 gp10 family phage protein